jgi:guanylate kinase
MNIDVQGVRSVRELAERNSYDYVIHSKTKEQDFLALLDYWAQARAKLQTR